MIMMSNGICLMSRVKKKEMSLEIRALNQHESQKKILFMRSKKKEKVLFPIYSQCSCRLQRPFSIVRLSYFLLFFDKNNIEFFF